MYKRITMLILTGIMTVCSATFQIPCTAQPAYAATVSYLGDSYDLDKKAFADMWTLQERLKNAALDGGGTVDVSDLSMDAVRWYTRGTKEGLANDAGERIMTVSEATIPYFNTIYTGAKFDVYYLDKRGTIDVICYDVELATKMFADIDVIMDEFRNGLSDNMSDEDKVTYIARFMYGITNQGGRRKDIPLLRGGGLEIDSVDFLLRNGEGICEGWERTADYLCMMSGILSTETSGTDHTWNLCNVDGKWYNCDFYWGYILHSDAAIFLLDNHDRIPAVTGIVCNDTRYDGKYSDTTDVRRDSDNKSTDRGAWDKLRTLETIKIPKGTTDPTRLSISRQTLTLKTGDTYPLDCGKYPRVQKVIDSPVTWISSNPSVATVSNGLVTGVSAGTATITVTSSNGISKTCTVTVKDTVADPNFVTSGETWSVSLYLNVVLLPYSEHKVYKVHGVQKSTYGTISKLPIPNNRKDFLGWYTEPFGKGKKITDDTVYNEDTAVLNLYAYFGSGSQSNSSKTATYTIKFNGNGSTSGSMPALKSCKVGTKYKLTANKFVRKGYKFAGWSLSKNGTVKYKNSTLQVFSFSSIKKHTICSICCIV